MKPTNPISVMMACVLLSFTIYSCKPSHVVTLLVDTDNINQQNVDDHCSFGQPSTISNKNFTTYAAKGDRIIWGAVSKTDPLNDVVKINKIKYKNGPQVLNKSELDGKKIVIGKVKRGEEGDTQAYWIHFTVFKDGVKLNGTFKLDPNIQVTK